MTEHEATTSSSQPVTVERIDRRRFIIRLGGSIAAVTVSGAAVSRMLGGQAAAELRSGEVERWSARNPLPNAGAAVRPVVGTRPEYTPLEDHYRMFNSPDLPTHTIEEWQLRVVGLVEQPLEWTLDEIKQHEPRHEFITLSCISNPVGGPLISTTRWTGTSLQELIPLWKLKPDASHLRIDGADGFYEIVSLETIRSDERVMLVYDWDGVPLPMEHGFPLRIYIPDVYGMKQPKWVVSIEATDSWEPGFSVAKTWDKDAVMETTSVIDTIMVGDSAAGTGGETDLLIGGIAHAGARGVSKVEVQVDQGDWRQAQLREPLSDLTWVLWRFAWPYRQGEHTVSVRAYDGSGRLQEEAISPPYPDGATGIHRKAGPGSGE